MKKVLLFTLLYLCFLSPLFGKKMLCETKAVTTIKNNDQPNTKSKLYPNPAIDFIQIKNSSNIRIKNISILSMVGSSMLNKDFTNSNDTEQINVSKLPSGRYFVKISYINGNQEILNLLKL